MSETITAFKIVMCKGDKIVSYCPIPGGELEYIPGEWTKTRPELAELGYYPVAMRTLDDTRVFGCMSQYDQIWSCELRDVIEGTLPLSWAIGFDTNVDRFVVVRGVGSEWPNGTVMAKQIKLLERIR